MLALALASSAAAKPVRLDLNFGNGGKAIVPVTLESPPEFWYGTEQDFAQDSQGRILVSVDHSIARFTPQGEIDRSFADGGVLTVAEVEGSQFRAQAISTDSQDRVIAVGSVISTDSRQGAAAVRFTADGGPDPTFGGGDGAVILDSGGPADPASSSCCGPVVSAAGVAADAFGRIVVSGSITTFGNYCVESVGFIRRLDSNGDVDRTYGNGGAHVYAVRDIHVADGLILGPSDEVLIHGRNGYCHGGEPNERSVVAELQSSGQPNLAFGQVGEVVADQPEQLAVDHQGRVLVLSPTQVRRLRPDGSPDFSFGRRGTTTFGALGKSGSLSGLVVSPKNGLVLTGTEADYSGGRAVPNRRLLLARVGPKGAIDKRIGKAGVYRFSGGGRANAIGRQVMFAEGTAVVGGLLQGPKLQSAPMLFGFDL